ncbi:glycosyltransferase family 25 protein [Bacteroides thetaiotaomicron]|uniref:glycosyltransferase family 25 protein n=1 Tax=Bacteroides thetaiotaomicron TaxID=818 RepID=UPI002165BC34|nr:glycosyltransferase family 25 protein [Bacteroides thetaiotaomicron]MCS2630730.1 glycosyltransferase family 25 protein [Bacteroides thetaiotaomicron]
MKAYIINLKKSVDRKKYMQEQLEKMFFLSAEFVEAVDARGMTEREKNVFFDTELFL